MSPFHVSLTWYPVATPRLGSESRTPGRISTSHDQQGRRHLIHSSSPQRGNREQYEQFLFRALKEAGKTSGIAGVTHPMLRRKCSTYMAQLTNVKDAQAHQRHANARITLEHYIKSVPESVRVAVESLDHLLKLKNEGPLRPGRPIEAKFLSAPPVSCSR
jgi:integrase